jgi:antitoxin component YwqK of YwqJK toxin-antitoxin module
MAPGRGGVTVAEPATATGPGRGRMLQSETSLPSGLYQVELKDSAGNLLLEGTYLERSMVKPHGTVRFFHPDGSLARVNNYRNGTPEGPWLQYFPNGQLLDSVGYKNGLRDGVYRRYHPNGYLQITGLYNENQASGTWRQYYQNGALASEKEYYSNQLISVRYVTRTGKVIEEQPSGLIGHKEIIFFDDLLERENELKYATYFGSPIKLKNGMFAVTLYTMEGQRAAQLHFTDRAFRNKSGPFSRYDENERLRISGSFRENRLDGPFTRWYASGLRSDSGLLSKGKPEGTWVSWHPDGSMKDSGQYIRGMREGLWTEWEKETNIRSIGIYRGGMREGEWKYYSPSGRILYLKKFGGRWKFGAPETIGVRDYE